MFNNPLHKAIREKLDSGLTHQQVYDEFAKEGEDNSALARMLMRFPLKATFDATKIYRNIIQCFALAHILFGVYFINNILKPSLSEPYLMWIKFGLITIPMFIVFGYFLEKNMRPNLIVLLIPVFYFNFLNDKIPPQFTLQEIINVVLFLLLFITEMLYTYKLKKGIVLERE